MNISNWTFKEYHCRQQFCVLIRSIPILQNGTVKSVSVEFSIWADVVCNQSISCFHSNLSSAVTVWECHWWYLMSHSPIHQKFWSIMTCINCSKFLAINQLTNFNQYHLYFLQDKCISCHTINSVTALKENENKQKLNKLNKTNYRLTSQTLKQRCDTHYDKTQSAVESVYSTSYEYRPQMTAHNLPVQLCNDNQTCPGVPAVLAVAPLLKTVTHAVSVITLAADTLITHATDILQISTTKITLLLFLLLLCLLLLLLLDYCNSLL